MKIVAGILLIIVAVVNLVGGFGYLFGGAVRTAAGEVGSEVAKESKKSGERDKKLEKDSKKEKKAGGFWMVFGLFLFLLMGLQIGGAVVLFLSKARIFVFIVAGLTVLAEVVGMSNVGFAVWQVLGLAAGVLAVVAALLYKPKTVAQTEFVPHGA